MRLINKENLVFLDKEIDITLTIRELQMIRDCISTSSYTSATKEYNITFNTEPPYEVCDLDNLYIQIQEILTNQGGYIL